MRRQVLSYSKPGFLMVVLLAMQLITSCLANIPEALPSKCSIPKCKNTPQEIAPTQKWKLVCPNGHDLVPEQLRYGPFEPKPFKAVCSTCGTEDTKPQNMGIENLAICKFHVKCNKWAAGGQTTSEGSGK
ncbi:hypothetical protein O181_008739 [Austropuccinia psidii MF-1]|uniref:Uncharacterized protein n=1 Tax=Austropuccinia psidii MF-1 TaxID=1389203 RepID=A0A9Q3BPF8_9BASI|nr:hypothetical protein [Austropuccinia psidii MF-1]